MRTQLSVLTKRCLESDQSSLVLKGNIIKVSKISTVTFHPTKISLLAREQTNAHISTVAGSLYFFEANTRRHTETEMRSFSTECHSKRAITERKGWQGECICRARRSKRQKKRKISEMLPVKLKYMSSQTHTNTHTHMHSAKFSVSQESLERAMSELKSIPVLQTSNDMLKNDIANLRLR